MATHEHRMERKRKIVLRLAPDGLGGNRFGQDPELDGMELALGDLAEADRSRSFLADLLALDPPVVTVAATCATAEVDRAIPQTLNALNAARRIGATCLTLSLPPLARADQPRGFAGYQCAINFAHALFDATRFEAERSGVALALEVAHGGCFLSPVEMRELISEANSWAVGACLDADRLAGESDLADWIRTLTHRTHAVRVGESSLGDAMGLRRIGGALDDVGYRRTICIATHPPRALDADLKRATQFLRGPS